MQFIKNPNFDFLGKRKFAYVISGILVFLGLYIVIFGKVKYGIDFTGGTLVQIKFDKVIDIGKVRNALGKIGLSKAEIQYFGSNREVLIKYQKDIDASDIVKILKKETGLAVYLMRTEKVGPRIGRELQQKAIKAVLIGMLLMLIYISFRFDFRFGVAAILALFHDVLVGLGIFTLAGREVNTYIIAALLTIIGYSINDSIVISDRIRENLRKGRPRRFAGLVDLFNRSLNQTLSRTIITSFTTLVVLIVLLIVGGPVIFDFAFILAIGVVVGTYSSIFVVASLVVDWEKLMPYYTKIKV